MTEEKLANPAVLGLTCFGLTTILLNLHNAGLFKQDASILAMGLFLGGLAQIIAGVMEFKKGNTFGTTAFIAYGSFWLTLVFIIVGKPFLGERLGLEASNRGLAWYLFIWGVFTTFLFIGTFKVNRVLQAVFATLIVLFFLLAISFGWGNGGLLKVAGVIGIVCGSLAAYLAVAELLNEMYGRTLFPIWPVGEKESYKRPEDL
ncbi:MAG: acetate uptake transporter [Actinobacteria bacterium]|nr:acetate uptake transporter [Actinomycetota bacterium]